MEPEVDLALPNQRHLKQRTHREILIDFALWKSAFQGG